MPGAVPATSTAALSNATLKYSLALANKGWEQAMADDAGLAAGLNVNAGKITYAAVAAAHAK
jgi:alanine dehydrogenase